MFRSAMSARARRGAHCAPERPRSGTRPNVQRISLPNARVAAVEKACARTQAQPKRASGRRCAGGRGGRAGAEGGQVACGRAGAGRRHRASGRRGARTGAREALRAGLRRGRGAMPSAVVENAPNVCAGKNTGQNASECVPESARRAQQTANAMHLPGILLTLMEMLPSEHPFQHALVGKMTSTLRKTRTRTKNDRAAPKATRADPKATERAQAQPDASKGCPNRAPAPPSCKKAQARAFARKGGPGQISWKGARPHGAFRTARSARRAPRSAPPQPAGIRSGGRAG